MAMPQGHHRFGFSSLFRRLPCPGSAGQEAAAEIEGSAPPVESFAESGIEFHAHLEAGTTPDDPTEKEAVEWVRSEWAAKVPANATETVYEDKVRVFDGDAVLAWGYLDMFRADLLQGVGYIGETKSGWVLHEAEIVAPQLVGQCIGVLCEYEQLREVRNTCFHARFRTTTQVSLSRESLPQAIAWYKDIIQASEAPEAPLNPGPQCRYCSGRVRCPVVKGLVEKYSLKKVDVSAMTDGAELALYLQAADILEEWCTSVKKIAKSKAIEGIPIPGRKLQRVAGARYIQSVPDLAKTLEKYLSHEQILGIADVGITAFEKLWSEQYMKVHGGTATNAKAVLSEKAGPLIAQRAEQIRLVRERKSK